MFADSPFILGGRIVEWFKHGLNHPMQLILADLFVGRIFLEFGAGFLSARSRFQGGFLEEQFLEIVGGVEVSLVGGWYEDWRDLLSLQSLEIYRLKEGVGREGGKAGCSNPFPSVLFEKR